MNFVTPLLLFAFFFSPLSGADVMKVRLGNDTYRIVLTGSEAQTLSASAGKEIFSSSSPVDRLSCSESPLRCEILIKSPIVQSFADIQERLRMAQDLGLPSPQAQLPRNGMEQIVTATVDDSIAAAKLYSLLPGPELSTRFDDSAATDFVGRRKALILADRSDLSLSCQQIERVGGNVRKGYTCVLSAIVPVADLRQASRSTDSN